MGISAEQAKSIIRRETVISLMAWADVKHSDLTALKKSIEVSISPYANILPFPASHTLLACTHHSKCIGS
jgi:hypothetical protein